RRRQRRPAAQPRERRPRGERAARAALFSLPRSSYLQLIRQRSSRLLAGHDRNDFEVGEIGPLRDPALKESDVAAFHQLETAPKLARDQSVHDFWRVGQDPAFLVKPPVNGFGVLVAEFFDHHEQHDKSRPLDVHYAAARSSPGSSGSFTGCLRLADKSSALV